MQAKLKRKELREIEREFNVYLDVPLRVKRTVQQQFGVYDENDRYCGDIMSRGIFFSADELREAIRLNQMPIGIGG